MFDMITEKKVRCTEYIYTKTNTLFNRQHFLNGILFLFLFAKQTGGPLQYSNFPPYVPTVQ